MALDDPSAAAAFWTVLGSVHGENGPHALSRAHISMGMKQYETAHCQAGSITVSLNWFSRRHSMSFPRNVLGGRCAVGCARVGGFSKRIGFVDLR